MSRILIRLALVPLALIVLALVPSVADADLYWNNNTNIVFDRSITRASEDGQTVRTIVDPAVGSGMSVDATHMYWASAGDGMIARADLDGSNVNTSFISSPFTGPNGTAVDSSHVYWANQSGTIGRANLDGTGADPNFMSVGDAVDVAVDASHIYWTNFSSGTIGRADLDGTNLQPSFITGASGPTLLTVVGGFIYWPNFSSTTIGRAAVDGTGVDQSFIAGVTRPSGVAVDEHHVFWANGASNLDYGSIGRADLDGSNVKQDLITGVAPIDLAIDSGPTVTSTPASLAFGTTPQGTLSARQAVTFTNHSFGALQVRGFDFSGSGAGDYVVSSDTCHAPVAYEDSCTVQVRFAPGAQGASAATMTAETNGDDAPQTALTGAGGPLPQGPQGPEGPNGPQGPAGANGRDAKVKCVVKKKKHAKKVKVKCKVQLVSPTSARVRWRLTSRGETVDRGTVRAHHGRASLGRDDFGALGDGRYALHIGGRSAATFVIR